MSNDIFHPHNVAIRELLKNIRIRKNISQSDVYKKSGIEISHYESNTCTPNTLSIMKLCEFYGFSFAGFWIICEEYFNKNLPLEKSVDFLLNWQKHESAFQTFVGILVEEE